MPKMKSHRGASKRMRFTGSGKIRRRKMNLRHILTKKSPKRKRNLGKGTLVAEVDMKRIAPLVAKSK